MQEPWTRTKFTYDAFGNNTKSGSRSFIPGYTTATNQIASGAQYDANGNLTWVSAEGAHQYSWDADGNLISVDGIAVTFDALDRAVEQANSGAYTQVVYGPSGMKLALMNGQSLTKAFVPLPGGATAVYNSGGLAYYRHPDWLGSSRFASTPGRTLYYSGAYAPFGESYSETPNTDRSFTGQNQDTEAGLYDFLFRGYSPVQGRWLSPDPAGLAAVNPADPQSWNRYAYLGNRPLTSVDPLGLWCWDGVNLWASDCPRTMIQERNSGGGGYWAILYTWIPYNCGDDCGRYAGTGYWQTNYFWVPMAGQPTPESPDPDRVPGGGGDAGWQKLGYKSLRACADDITKHFSIAGLLPGAPGLPNTFLGGVVNGLLGNSVQGWSEAYDWLTSKSDTSIWNLYGSLLADPPQGVKGPTEAFIKNLSKEVQYSARLAGQVKVAQDLTFYGMALAYCYSGKF